MGQKSWLCLVLVVCAVGCGPGYRETEDAAATATPTSSSEEGTATESQDLEFPDLEPGEVDEGLDFSGLDMEKPKPPGPEPVHPDQQQGLVRPSLLDVIEKQKGARPNFNFTQKLQVRFKGKMNQAVGADALTTRELIKWNQIFSEMRKIGNVRNPSPDKLKLLFIDEKEALQLSERYEKEGFISPIGAWSIAVQGTAKRHGFTKVPCAEFMSEVIRQAYERAGYSPTEDFSKEKGNTLIYNKTASVTGLGNALVTAGWSVWDASQYRPPVGAILIHTVGVSPSHIYMAGGDDGMWIVDNGAPKGRDLRKTKDKTVGMMFKTGAFFLPPGQTPATWQ